MRPASAAESAAQVCCWSLLAQPSLLHLPHDRTSRVAVRVTVTNPASAGGMTLGGTPCTAGAEEQAVSGTPLPLHSSTSRTRKEGGTGQDPAGEEVSLTSAKLGEEAGDLPSAQLSRSKASPAWPGGGLAGGVDPGGLF